MYKRQILTTAPPALRAYPRGSEPLWDVHYRTRWDALQRLIREEADPEYDAAPPPSRTVPRTGGDPVNSCAL
ncbi:hypothetical protein ADK38_40470 [Streptomyces varsoviensis]|uniref:Uncharacterized protein n=1 Tax=Streptomyces varsoviensis TaxID=67373 RepID=A0ABR5IUE1_9ACTN|nr:hypothetical protein ADK38_40470 [Streptomyces varsoviensis]